MTGGLPQTKAADLFTRMSRIGLEDVEAAHGFASELIGLNRQMPGDFTTKVALAEALLVSGKRGAAIDQIMGAHAVRRHDLFPQMDRLALLLFFVGYKDSAIKVVEEYAFADELFASGMLGDNAVQIAAWAADFDLLNRLAKRHPLPEFEGMAERTLELLSALPSGKFEIHQDALIDIMKDFQVAVSCASMMDADGEWLVINSMFFDSTLIERRTLEKKVSEAIFEVLEDSLEGLVANVFTAAPTLTPRLRVLSSV